MDPGLESTIASMPANRPSQMGIEGHVDYLDVRRVEGWAWDRFNPQAGLTVHATHNGVLIGQGLANLMRRDVAGTGRGTGRYGFAIYFNTDLPAGAVPKIHIVTPEGSADLLDADKEYVVGALESSSLTDASGWVWNPAKPDVHLEVRAWSNGQIISVATANQDREDLRRLGIGTGQYGFSLRFARPLSAGANLEVRVGERLLIIPKKLVNTPNELDSILGASGAPLSNLIAPIVTSLKEEPGSSQRAVKAETKPQKVAGLWLTRFKSDSVIDRTFKPGSAEKRLGARFEPGNYEDDTERLISTYLDVEYYISSNRDVYGAGVDPVIHYTYTGWREGRDPTPWFNTAFYLQSGPDVAQAGINPFWHYLVAGHDEGRLPKRAGGFRREQIDKLKTAWQKTEHYHRAEVLEDAYDDVASTVIKAIKSSIGLVVALSHDNYLEITGGIQVFLSDEELKFRRNKIAYLHIFPRDPYLCLINTPSHSLQVGLNINGQFAGTLSVERLCKLLGSMDEQLDRIMTIHSVLGFSAASVVQIAEVIQPSQCFWWLHDFTAICCGYNLLRNDVAFCGGPPVESISCRVCIYGQDRLKHLAGIRSIFENTAMTVVSPSETALKIFTEATKLPYKTSQTHEHAVLKQLRVRRHMDPDLRGTEADPIRIAFIGYPTPHKGWPIFEDLVVSLAERRELKFYHFGTKSALPLMHNVSSVVAQTSRESRDSMTKALIKHDIDLVLVLSIWPETFSYVTFEALASGADVVSLKDGGNVSHTILKMKRGIVAEDETALKLFFESGAAVRYVRLARKQGSFEGTLIHCGTTASLVTE